MEEESVKSKNTKPIYKRKWFIILAIIIVWISYVNISSKVSDLTKGEKINQSELILGNKIPDLPKCKGVVKRNSESELQIELYNVSQKKYKKFLGQVRNTYNTDVDERTSVYEANDNERNHIEIRLYKSELNIYLKVSGGLKDVSWPKNDMVNKLPVPKSLKGEIKVDKSNELLVYIDGLNKDEYDEYVNKCSENGFNIDYNKGEKSYSAKHADGYELSLLYEFGRMSINLKAIEKTTAPSSTQTTETTPSVAPTVTPSAKPSETVATKTGLSKEFKDAMDAYESYMNEYVAFMKKYKANSTDTSLLSQYSSMLEKYTQQLEKFEKYDDTHTLTQEEMNYYLEVQNRVNKKLLEISM